MKTIFRILICIALPLVACSKPKEATKSVATEAEIRAAAKAAMREVISSDGYRRDESAARDALQGAKAPGAVELARMDLEKTLAAAAEDEKKHDGGMLRLHEITAGKPPYWQALEGYRSAVGMASDDERNQLRTMDLDQVVKKFGVGAQ